jgi:hypothetical protein
MRSNNEGHSNSQTVAMNATASGHVAAVNGLAQRNRYDRSSSVCMSFGTMSNSVVD